ncbi:MAG: hypothetical protein A3H45_08370 [Ignavibacteria bacterium RIFCSPLOWO2_02_FULL_55_14]|nr:MAG: hypothetical protein A3H45_08370 [Ignavibacteria bacterium RIFCSPLOWO2_02_FULL_55_14]
MLRAIQSRLELKILLLIILVLVVGFGTYVILTIQRESEALIIQQREKLRISTETLAAGIRNVMLTGKAPYAVEMVNDVRQNVRFVDITIYDRFGREVFLREGEGMNTNVNDPMVADVISTRSPRSAMNHADSGSVFTLYEPLHNRPECWRCHDPKEPMRGALQVALRPSAVSSMSATKSVRGMAGALGNTIATAFRTIMLGGNGDQMDTLIAASHTIPGVRLVQVYDRMGFLHFGPEDYEIPDTQLLDILAPKTSAHVYEMRGKVVRVFVPLVNEDRCQVCHGSRFPMRGIMMVEFDAATLASFAEDVEHKFTEAMQAAIREGFRSIMLVGRAGSARFYMDELRSLDVLQTLRVYDANGFERFLNPPPRTRPELKSVIANKDTLEFMEGEDEAQRLVRIVHIPNESRCYACHSSNHQVRSAIEVSVSMSEINARLATNKLRSAGAGVVTILFVWLVIRLFMRRVVVTPVHAIGQVAERVGAGDFSSRAEVASLDEIGRLAERINEMVRGLRERFHLEKFVSQQTIDAVRSSDLSGVKLGGSRRTATVFFSDIRGFTAFSEVSEPERVVAMLNASLAAQAGIVKRHGGDIDKYVGDELVAVFGGEGMVERAVRAALDIQRELPAIMRDRGMDSISVGIGINTGDMVMGAMGSVERMDYTVIGDAVNLGARLCSAAKPGQVLLSETSARALGTPEWCLLNELEPMAVKGKREPVKVFEAVQRA